jgi:thioredoxin-related protein
VNGVKKDLKGQADVIHLNLMSKVGRQAADKFGVRIVPVTLLFDGQGNIIGRQAGMPDAQRLMEQIQHARNAFPREINHSSS